MNTEQLIQKFQDDVQNDTNWQLILSLAPNNWCELMHSTGIIQRSSRSEYSDETWFRGLLLHHVTGKSLRETATIMSVTYDRKITDVAFYKKQKKSGEFFKELSINLLKHLQAIQMYPVAHGLNIRLVDGTNIKEPGVTGSLYRIMYSLSINEFCADYIDVSPVKGKGHGESFKRVPVSKNDCMIGDRGYCTYNGIKYIIDKEGYVIVRYAHKNVNLYDLAGHTLPLFHFLKGIKNPGESIDIPILCSGTDTNNNVRLRLCAIKKTPDQYQRCIRKIEKKMSKTQRSITEETKALQEYVILLTNLDDNFKTHEIFEWYRVRWQIELCFKRMKSLMKLGALPKKNEESAIAWLYGKLFTALLIEKFLNCLNSKSFSPWGFCAHAP